METITWVGLNHYISAEELEEFYDTLKEGDVVLLVLEPENFWDEDAVAVFHNFIMRGHISRHETSKVHLMAKHNMELVGRITDDIDRELNQVKITIDTVQSQTPEEKCYPMLEEQVLGIASMNPHVMYEEVSFRQIKMAVNDAVRVIKTNDINNKVVEFFVSKIKAAITTYLSIWDCSISEEANVLPRYFDGVLTDLSLVSKPIKDALMPDIKKLRKCTSLQPRTEQNVKSFEKQLKALENVYSLPDGFFDYFDKMHQGKKQELRKRLDAIDKWLKRLTASKNCMYCDDYDDFVHLLYCRGFRARDLYMIITHMLLMRHIMVVLYGIDATTPMRNVGHIYAVNRSRKVVVNKSTVHMQGGNLTLSGNTSISGDIIEPGGTKIVK